MWNEKINIIAKEKNLYGEKLNYGATEKEIKEFEKESVVELNVELPKEYIQILSEINGFEYNGFIFYGIDETILDKIPNQHINGLIEYNKIWYENEWQTKYLFLGESNISWYVYDLSKKKYCELDNPLGSKIEEFNDIYHLLDKLLSDSLE